METLIAVLLVAGLVAKSDYKSLPSPSGQMLVVGPRVRIQSPPDDIRIGRLRWVTRDTMSLSLRGTAVSIPMSRVTKIEIEQRPWKKRAVKGALIGAGLDVALIGWGFYYDTHHTDTYGSATFGALAAFPVLTIGGGSVGYLTRRRMWVPATKP